VTMNVIHLPPTPATLTGLRIGVMVGVTTVALGSIDCAVRNRIGRALGSMG
jgi:hypothetical protein